MRGSNASNKYPACGMAGRGTAVRSTGRNAEMTRSLETFLSWYAEWRVGRVRFASAISTWLAVELMNEMNLYASRGCLVPAAMTYDCPPTGVPVCPAWHVAVPA